MPQHVDVPGMGVVEFPDGMDDDAIATAIKANMSSAAPIGGIPLQDTTFGGDAQYKTPYPAPPGYGMMPTPGLPGPASLADVLNVPLHALGTVAAGGMNQAARLGANAVLPGSGTTMPPPFAAGKPMFNLAEPLTEAEKAGMPGWAAGTYGAIANTANSFTTPEMALAMPLAAAPILRAPAALGFGTQMAAGMPGAVQQTMQTIKDPGATTAEKWESGVGTGLQGAMAGLTLAHGARPALPEAAPKPLTTKQALKDLPGLVNELRAALQQQQIKPQQVGPPLPPAPPEPTGTVYEKPPEIPPTQLGWPRLVENLKNAFGAPMGLPRPVPGTPPPPVVPLVSPTSPFHPHTQQQDQGVAPTTGAIPTTPTPEAQSVGAFPPTPAPVAADISSTVLKPPQPPTEPAAASLPATPSPQDQVAFQHDLKQVATLIKGNQDLGKITPAQAQAFAARGDQLFAAGDRPAVDVLRQDVLKAAGTATKETPGATVMETPSAPLAGEQRPTKPSALTAVEQAEVNKELAVALQQSPQNQPYVPFEQEYHRASVGDRMAIDELNIREKPNAFDAMKSMAEKPDLFGTTHAGLADFLTRNFEAPLRAAALDPSGGSIGRTHYDPINHRIHLKMDDSDYSLPFSLLHESAHAATFWQFENPMSEGHKVASKTIKELRAQAIDALTPEMRKFFDEIYKPYIEKAQAGGVALSPDIFSKFDDAGIHRQMENVMYALSTDHEFIGGLFTNKLFRGMLNSLEYQGKGLLGRFVDSVKELLGIKTNTALDKAFDALIEASDNGADRFAPSERVGMPQAPHPGPQLVADMSSKERLRGIANYFKGWSANRHVAVSEDLGNKLVAYASSDIAAPVVAKSLATEVLGSHYKDTNFINHMGAVLVEDQLRAVRKGFEDAAKKATDPAVQAEMMDKAQSVQTLVGQPYSPFKDEAAYQRILAHPDMKAAIDRHMDTIQPLAEKAHVDLGGKLAAGGEQTGAFANLIAILAPDDVDSTRKMIYGNRQGDITNQLRKGSVFSKQRAGTAWMYQTDYRVMAERMVRGNWQQQKLRELIKGYTDAGVGVEQKVGGPRPEGDLVPKTIELRGTGPGMTRHIKLWLRRDLMPEFNQALQTDSPIYRAGVGMLLDAISDIQVAGLTDGAYHTGNMIASIATSQGGGNALVDIARKVPGVGFLDAVGRVGMAARDVVLDHPAVQAELAQIARVGAGRAPLVHRSLIGKAIKAVTGTDKLDPSFWSGKAIQLLDKAGRVVHNRMFDNLVDRKLVEDNDLNRREFINRMGQYNRRLMGQVTNIARDLQIAPFVVAGKNFNRLALSKLILQDPGVRAANPQAWVKLRAMEAVGTLTALAALPVVANLLITKTMWGRAGTPVGAIDLGSNDEQGRPKVFDPLQALLYRRGMRLIGAPELDKGGKEKLTASTTAGEMVKKIVEGQLHPWMGPVPRFAKTVATGYDTSGYLLSRNPDDVGQNVKAALKHLNPMVAAWFSGPDEGKKGGLAGVGQSLLAPFGVKTGRFPSHTGQVEAAVQKLGHAPSLSDSLHIERDLKTAKTPNENVLAEREASRKQLFKDFARQDRMVEALSPEAQDFLSKNHLKIAGFQSEITAGGIRLPMNAQEGREMEGVFGKWYQKGLEQVMKRPGFVDLPQDRKQLVLDKTLDAYRKAARAQWEAQLLRQGRGQLSR